jgi:hypothetical protein
MIRVLGFIEDSFAFEVDALPYLVEAGISNIQWYDLRMLFDLAGLTFTAPTKSLIRLSGDLLATRWSDLLGQGKRTITIRKRPSNCLPLFIRIFWGGIIAYFDEF